MSNLSYVAYTGDGVTNQFLLAVDGGEIGYLRTDDIHVYVNDVEVTFNIETASPHLVILDAAPASGSEVVLRREMPQGTTYSDFSRGNKFGPKNMNNSFQQGLYLTQEILDGYLPEGSTQKQDLNFGGDHTPTNLRAPVEPSDSATKSYVDIVDAEQGARIVDLESKLITSGDNRTIAWPYNSGAANGGELIINVGFPFESINQVVINGAVQTYGLAWDYNRATQTVELAEELDALDELVISGGITAAVALDLTVNNIKEANTVAHLRTIEPLMNGQQIDLLGHTIAGIGGGKFWHDASDTTSADNNGTVIVTSKGGRWKRPLKRYFTVEDFGAIPDWNGSTGTDCTSALVACVNSVDNTIISGSYAVGLNGSAFFKSVSNKKISGWGSLHKIGRKGIFSFKDCSDITIENITMDGQIVADELAAGNILDGSRASVNYAFAVSYASSSNCSVKNTTIYDFSWDGLVSQGKVAADGLTATQASETIFSGNNLQNIRGSSTWLKSISGLQVTNNKYSNEAGFHQRANHIFLVEWCGEGIVSGNRSYNCGDNAIGIGEMLSDTVAARCNNITVHDNVINGTRYHSILVAQGVDINVHDNIIKNAGDKDRYASPATVLTGAITVLGGGSAPRNTRISVKNNKIYNPFEFGITVIDRAGTTTDSDDIEVLGNTVVGAGKQAQVSRIRSGGIFSQTRIATVITNNKITFCDGPGIEWYGDAVCKDNVVKSVTGYGIHCAKDTVFFNSELLHAIEGNSVSKSLKAGIRIESRTRVDVNNNRVVDCGSVGALEDIEDVIENSGIAIKSAVRVNHSNNETNGNQGAGFVTHLVAIVHGSVGHSNGNGAGYTTSNFKSGYLHNNTPSQAIVKSFLMQGAAFSSQEQFITVLNPDNSENVALDCDPSGHTTNYTGTIHKSAINIA